MAEEPAIAETDAILENAKNKHEVRCSIYRKTKSNVMECLNRRLNM